MAEVLLITALVLGMFFVFFIRPARAVQSRRRRDLNELRIGDEVLTAGGIIATVEAVETPPNGPMILQLEIDDGVVVKAHTSAVDRRLRSADEVAAARFEETEPEDAPASSRASGE
jgi:preprotein translocase subunit YajC